nr:hypothetical protein [uncultured Flavobacterium sp.]
MLDCIECLLKVKEQYNPENQTVTLTDFRTKEHLDWPEEATHVLLATATAN